MNLTSRAKNEIAKVISDEDALINKKLPKELLLRIFSYLDVVSLCRCAQVSKAWNVLALDGSNWQRIDLFNFQRDIEGPVVENISLRCGGFLKKLSLRGCKSVGDGALKTFAQYCNHIEELNLNECKQLTDSTCQSLSKYCPKLTHLDLGSCSQFTNLSLKSIGFSSSSNLEAIRFKMAAKKRGGKKRASETKNQNESKSKKLDDIPEKNDDEVKDEKNEETDDTDTKTEDESKKEEKNEKNEIKNEKAEEKKVENSNSKEKSPTPPVKRVLRSSRSAAAKQTRSKVTKLAVEF